MLQIRVKEKDLAWSYIAQILSMGVGVITLPFILSKLTAEEIGLNYILITIGSVIALVDLGFAPQFARNFTYVFSGAQELKKVGIGDTKDEINYDLLHLLLKTARYIYLLLGLLAIVLLILIGTPYIYHTTNGFTSVPNALWIWIIYSLGVLFQIFYSYYFSMLLGAGKIQEQKKALVANKILYMIILIGGLFCGWGLLSVALAQLISPFIGRWMSYRWFFTEELQQNLIKCSKGSAKEVYNIFKTLWYNAKRVAIMNVGAYAIIRFSMFIAGLYLTLNEFASYGLMVQLVGIIGAMGSTFLQVIQPRLASLKTQNKTSDLLSEFSMSILIFYAIFFITSIILILFGNQILFLIKSNATLPDSTILIVYCIVMLLEFNHSNFSILISTNNHIPFAPASISTGIAVAIGTFFILKYSSLGIMGLVIVQGLCQLAYQNWKWPKLALDEYHIGYFALLNKGKLLLKNIMQNFFSYNRT